MTQSNYKLRDFAIAFSKLAKIIWNDEILYDDTLGYYDPCLSSIEVLKDVRVHYMDKVVYNLNIDVKNGHELILKVQGEN